MFHAMFNAYWEPLAFELPPPDVRRTGRGDVDRHDRDAPHDIYDGVTHPPCRARPSRFIAGAMKTKEFIKTACAVAEPFRVSKEKNFHFKDLDPNRRLEFRKEEDTEWFLCPKPRIWSCSVVGQASW